jgi:hypothetical protein
VAVDLGMGTYISLLLILLSAGKNSFYINNNYSMGWNGIHIGINLKSINIGLVF